MSVLGVAHSVLGQDRTGGVASRYRDSGMAGTASAEHPKAFVGADLGEAAALMAAHIRAVQPDVVVTYDEHGGYDHPDHVQTHRVTMAALAALAAEAEAGCRLDAAVDADPEADADAVAMPAVFCILTPRSWATQDREWLRENVASGDSGCVVLQQDASYPPSVVPDETVTHVVQEPALVQMQTLALAQHATQVRVHQGYYSLSNHVAVRLSGREGFARFDPVAGQLVPAANGAQRYHGLLPESEGRG